MTTVMWMDVELKLKSNFLLGCFSYGSIKSIPHKTPMRPIVLFQSQTGSIKRPIFQPLKFANCQCTHHQPEENESDRFLVFKSHAQQF